MLRNNLFNGVRLGFTAGLVVTLFDSFFILKPNIFFTISFPVTLFVFNLFFWTLMGAAVALPLTFFSRKSRDFNIRQNHYWILFFLLPFSILYGVLGRLNADNFIKSPFDYHLSFFWVALIFFLLFFGLKKNLVNKKTKYFSFIPEITAIVFLYMFCSNISNLPFVRSFSYLLFDAETQMSAGGAVLLKVYRAVIYISGILMAMVLYARVFLKSRFFYQKKYFPLILLFLITVSVLSLNYKISSHRFLAQNYSDITLPSRQISGKVPSVILIVLDTVRADRLSVYGFKDSGTNSLEAFSRDALVFDNCIASSSWTYPSHASLFTGLYPVEHGNHDTISESTKPVRMKSLPPLNNQFITLADVFKSKGYYTAGVVSNCTLLHKGLNFHKGFQTYDCSMGMGAITFYPFRPILPLICYITNYLPKFYVPYRSAEETNTNIFGLLKTMETSPFFLFVNYMDAHNPYSPPRPFSTDFSDKRFPNLFRLKTLLPARLIDTSNDIWMPFLRSQYDGEIAYLDSQLEVLFSQLKKIGRYDSSLIVITSDHGELFDEHGYSVHKVPLYQGVVNVPLLIKWPSNAKTGRSNNLITLSDVYTSILDICGLPIPEGISGNFLGDSHEPVVSEMIDKKFGIHRALYYDKYKYMNYGYNKQAELYDLEKDPLEKINLAAKLPKITADMDEKLLKWEEQHQPKYDLQKVQKNIEVSPETEDALKALGYIQ